MLLLIFQLGINNPIDMTVEIKHRLQLNTKTSFVISLGEHPIFHGVGWTFASCPATFFTAGSVESAKVALARLRSS
jgi:hypothetical protein